VSVKALKKSESVLMTSLPLAKISTSDVTRLINSDEIQSVLRPAGQPVAKRKSVSQYD
jgi:hypothetical protein